MTKSQILEKLRWSKNQFQVCILLQNFKYLVVFQIKSNLYFETDECIQWLDLENSTLTSPNYPNNYGDNLNCQWLIETNETKFIKLIFNTFNVSTVSL